MLTLTAVQSAALSEQPWQNLDTLVKGELAAGRRVADLARQFGDWLDAVCDTPGLSEDGRDAYGDTLDSLTGNCSPRYRYEDAAVLPTPAATAGMIRVPAVTP